MKSGVLAKIFLLVSIKNLTKTCICINDFNILKIGFQKIFLLYVNYIIDRIFYNNLDFKSTYSSCDVNIFSNKIEKDLKNTKLKLAKKRFIQKLLT